jgi:hypothetical protein
LEDTEKGRKRARTQKHRKLSSASPPKKTAKVKKTSKKSRFPFYAEQAFHLHITDVFTAVQGSVFCKEEDIEEVWEDYRYPYHESDYVSRFVRGIPE